MMFIVPSAAMPARKISEILEADDTLGKLAAASRRVQQLQRIYLEAVPAAFSRVSRIGWARAGVVSVIASNGAVAAKLRHLTPRILEAFRRHGIEFNSMRIEVQVDAGRPAALRSASPQLPPAALAAIDAPQQSTPPTPLRAALRRLGRHRSQQPLEDVEQHQHQPRDDG
jgi:hypothetical protein